MPDAVESLASRFEVLKPHLNERQRRLWLGAEARELGSGGVGIVAQAVGVAGDTVRRGRAELEEPQPLPYPCLLYTSDAADDLLCVDLGGRRIIKKKKKL